ncbi:hypothetical protein [Phaeovulum sp.]|nr:hypothetical protein [Phaeovulum sp.]MDP1668811.1 hypothetical protein [Phaeovulum sp.]MDZ4119336.1 hypothetical protein [Phaeovulum sp.]
MLTHLYSQASWSCAFNAASETFVKTLKVELIWRQPWQTQCQVEAALFQ